MSLGLSLGIIVLLKTLVAVAVMGALAVTPAWRKAEALETLKSGSYQGTSAVLFCVLGLVGLVVAWGPYALLLGDGSIGLGVALILLAAVLYHDIELLFAWQRLRKRPAAHANS